MHESHLGRVFLNAALERLEPQSTEKILAVRGWVAETESLSVSSLSFHFSAAAVGTRAEGAELDVRVTHVRVSCEGCQNEYLPEHHLLLCPECGSTRGAVLGRTGFGIDEIEVRSP
jgi:hydrogenase nickel insertion protein HypA